jgi:hypothetical protein
VLGAENSLISIGIHFTNRLHPVDNLTVKQFSFRQPRQAHFTVSLPLLIRYQTYHNPYQMFRECIDDSRQLGVVLSAQAGHVQEIGVTRVAVTLQIHCMAKSWIA